MGTRSLTVFLDCNVKINEEKPTEIAVMYQQMDGYPSGHGQELADFLSEFTVVNGLSTGQPKKIMNGPHCGAAQIVAHFKEGAGSIYLYPAGTKEAGEDYIYYVEMKTGEMPKIKCEAFDGTELFYGPANQFDGQKIENEDEDED